MKKQNRFSFLIVMLVMGGFTMALAMGGCATQGRTGALAGSGLGALTGQIIGKDTKSTLIGAGIGAGVGYVIGNERDKTRAADNKVKKTFAPLGGTRWRVTSIKPANKVPKFKTKIVEFKKDGRLVTTTTYPDKSRDVSTESYRVTGNTLIVNRKGYIINYKFRIQGKTLTARANNVVITLQRF